MCSDGTCTSGCSDPRDCATDLVCDLSVTPTGRCDPCDDAENPCPRGQVCVDFACGSPCGTSASCPDGLWCTPAKQCDNCDADGECGPERVCRGGRCKATVECSSDQECQAAFDAPRAYCDFAREPDVCAVGACTSDARCAGTPGT